MSFDNSIFFYIEEIVVNGMHLKIASQILRVGIYICPVVSIITTITYVCNNSINVFLSRIDGLNFS